MRWSEFEAKEVIAKRRIQAEAGKCRNCGAEADVEMIYVGSMGGDDQWVPGDVTCSARCYETDPEGYLEKNR